MAHAEVPALETPVAKVDRGNGQPDPRALALIRELQQQLPDTQVVLFGSRATGDWRPGSDIDLAVIGVPEPASRDTLWDLMALADKLAQRQYHLAPHLLPDIQVEPFSWSDFLRLRTSRPHMAGQIQYKGLTALGEKLSPVIQDNDWPGIQVLLLSTRANLETSLKAIADGRDRKVAVQYAQAALETALKAALSTIGRDWDRKHFVDRFGASLALERPEWWQNNLTDETLKALGKFRAQAAYMGEDLPWPEDPPEFLVDEVQAVCGKLVENILLALGKAPQDVGYPAWDGSVTPPEGWEELPLFGWEKVDWARFSNRAEVERSVDAGRREGRAIGRTEGMEIGRTEADIKTMHLLLSPSVPQADRDRVAAWWSENGSPLDALERIIQVQQGLAEWAILLPPSWEEGEADDNAPPDRDRPPGGLS